MGLEVLTHHAEQDISGRQETKHSHLSLVKSGLSEEDNTTTFYREKRLVDLVLGSIGFLAFILVYPIVAIAIKLSSPGPVLFKQTRNGLNGDSFLCYKFRSMDTEKRQKKNGEPVVTEKDDDRIFPLGQFMRRYNIDEIPQIMNVLKGEMSLVGPRPYHVKESNYWNGMFEDYQNRYIVPPGITGFAQARGYRGGTLDEESMRRRLDNDLIYVEKNSMKLDLVIMYKTVYRMIIRDTNGH